MSVSIPPSVLNSEVLAEDIYSTWRELMITDRVPNIEGWPIWTKLSADWRKALVEACKMCATASLNRVQDALDSQLEFSFPDNEPEVLKLDGGTKRTCYVCGYAETCYGKIPVCAPCARSHKI